MSSGALHTLRESNQKEKIFAEIFGDIEKIEIIGEKIIRKKTVVNFRIYFKGGLIQEDHAILVKEKGGWKISAEFQAVGPSGRVSRPGRTNKYVIAKQQIELLGQSLDQFRLDVGRYPTTREGLSALMVNMGIKGWEGPYLKRDLSNDPWGRPYIYKSPGEHGDYDLFSFGRDGRPGGMGEDRDVKSWE